MIRDLHPDHDLKYSFKYDFDVSAMEDNFNRIKNQANKIQRIEISARRNFKEIAFAPLINKEMKLTVEKKAVEILGDLFGTYTQLNKVEDDVKSFLNENGISVEKNPDHDEAGFNEDWPLGRGVFIDDDKSFVVLVNFEDHLNIISFAEDGDIKKAVDKVQKVLNVFEKKVGYASDN
jgi:protein-arginine kinase